MFRCICSFVKHWAAIILKLLLSSTGSHHATTCNYLLHSLLYLPVTYTCYNYLIYITTCYNYAGVTLPRGEITNYIEAIQQYMFVYTYKQQSHTCCNVMKSCFQVTSLFELLLADGKLLYFIYRCYLPLVNAYLLYTSNYDI